MTRFILDLDDLESQVSSLSSSYDEEGYGHEIVVEDKNVDDFLDELAEDFKKLVFKMLKEE